MRILVGISGGLDSAYAALKLKKAGHDVVGAVLKMHEYTELDAAYEAARSVGIQLITIDCTSDFEKYVKSNFVNEYARGATPNPCVVCNSNVKFKRLYEYAMQNGFDKIATGHYAKIECIEDENGVRYAFSSATDRSKDQTYMLWNLSQDIMSSLILPLGDEVKDNVRARASELGLEVAHRKDSQEICFIPDGDYASYIEDRLGAFPEGDFISADGRVLGRHKGVIRYTVGQRKGLGIALGARVFVTDLDPLKNTVTLSDAPILSNRVSVSDVVFSGIYPPEKETAVRCEVKLRYAQSPVSATVFFRSDRSAEILLDLPVKSVTKGQSAVAYKDGILIAGGVISLSSLAPEK